ncbi:MAG: hypothetical protein VB949_07500, partial [Pseudomonadales bacterium]
TRHRGEPGLHQVDPRKRQLLLVRPRVDPAGGGKSRSGTQGKIERYHRTMKNVVKLQHYYFPWELEAALRDFVAYCNNERYLQSLDNVTPADVYFRRQYAVLTERDKIKRLTMKRRKREYLAGMAA